MGVVYAVESGDSSAFKAFECGDCGAMVVTSPLIDRIPEDEGSLRSGGPSIYGVYGEYGG